MTPQTIVTAFMVALLTFFPMMARAQSAPARHYLNTPAVAALFHLLPHISRDRYHDIHAKWRMLEHAQQIAAHESPRTTKLYDRTQDELLDHPSSVYHLFSTGIAAWVRCHFPNYLV